MDWEISRLDLEFQIENALGLAQVSIWTDQNFEICASGTLLFTGWEPTSLFFFDWEKLGIGIHVSEPESWLWHPFCNLYVAYPTTAKHSDGSKVQILTHFSYAEKIVLEIVFLKWPGFSKGYE